MRPVLRRTSPRATDFDDYRDAFAELCARLGPFCSYCERRIATNLAVEHIQPKDLPAYAHLIGRWENYLLGCVNCNSTKGDKDVVLSAVLLPDRDNTSHAFVYSMDGKIAIHSGLDVAQKSLALATLALTGLDKAIDRATDSNGALVAVDRVAQRMETWLIARESRTDLLAQPTDAFRRQVVRTAIGHGFFSIWMAVFDDDPLMRRLFIEAFAGTAQDCFDDGTRPISPRPGNGLPDGGKV